MQVTGGSLYGLTEDSVLAVSRAGQVPDPLLGYALVGKVTALSAEIRPVAYRDKAAPAGFSDHARCDVVYREAGAFWTTVATATDGFTERTEQDRANSQLQEALAVAISAKSSLLRAPNGSEQAEWLAVRTPSEFFIQRGTSTATVVNPASRRRGDVFGPFPNVGTLLAALDRIARASCLVKLADIALVPSADGPQPSIQFKLDVTRSGKPLPLTGAEVHPGETLELAIHNTGLEDLAVVVFYVGSDGDISPAFPFPGSQTDLAENFVKCNADLFRQISIDIGNETLGWEHVVVIAVPARDRAALNDLLRLQQRGSVLFQTRDGQDDQAKSPLGRLIDSAIGGRARAERTSASSDIGACSIQRMSWNVVQ
jgi:hypothetical protein